METIAEKNGFKVSLEQDQDAESPREFDGNLGKMVCWHRLYNLGDEQPKESPAEWRRGLASSVSSKDLDDASDEQVQKILDRHFIILPLYLYDHSGITMNTSPFSCPWDSGQVGIIYVSLEDVKKEWGNKGKRAQAKAIKCLQGEVEVYDQFLTGDVYGYVVEGPNGEDLDSCWGFFGYEYAKQEALDALNQAVKENNDKNKPNAVSELSGERVAD